MNSVHPIPISLLLRWLRRIEFPHKLGFCDRLFGRKLAGYGICWVETAAGPVWRLNLGNPTHRWTVYGYYEGGGFLRWAKRHLSGGGVVVDSRANIGQMTLYFGTWLTAGKVLAFEPGNAAAAWLQDCLRQQSAFSVELIRSGLSDVETTVRLANATTEGTHGSQAAITSSGEGEAIQVVRLDRLLAERGIREVSLWKLDVEGHEIPALRGAESMLSEHRCQALYVELTGENGRLVIEYLARLGYEPHGLTWRGGVTPFAAAPEHGNALFLPG